MPTHLTAQSPRPAATALCRGAGRKRGLVQALVIPEHPPNLPLHCRDDMTPFSFIRIFTRASQIDKSARCLRHRRLRPLRSPGRAADFACPACVPFLGPCRIPEAPRPSQRSPRPPLLPHVGRPRLQRRQGRLCWPWGARVRPRPGERRHFLLRLQAVREPAERVAVPGPAWKHALRYTMDSAQASRPRPGRAPAARTGSLPSPLPPRSRAFATPVPNGSIPQ